MDDVARRVAKCFQTVFPRVAEPEIPLATQASLEEWDSIGAVTLGNLIEEEFGIPMDFEKLPELDSFERVLEWVRSELLKVRS